MQRKFNFKLPGLTDTNSIKTNAPPSVIVNVAPLVAAEKPLEVQNDGFDSAKTNVTPNYVLNKNPNLAAKASIIPFSVVNKKQSPKNKLFKKTDDDEDSSNKRLTKKSSPMKLTQGKVKQTNLNEFMNKGENKQFKPMTSNKAVKPVEDCETKLKEFNQKVIDSDEEDFSFANNSKKTAPQHTSTQIPNENWPNDNTVKVDSRPNVKHPKLAKLMSPSFTKEKSNDEGVKQLAAIVKPQM